MEPAEPGLPKAESHAEVPKEAALDSSFADDDAPKTDDGEQDDETAQDENEPPTKRKMYEATSRMAFTQFAYASPLNQKNYYTEYLKKDDQV